MKWTKWTVSVVLYLLLNGIEENIDEIVMNGMYGMVVMMNSI